jgi:hypothetical protein
MDRRGDGQYKFGQYQHQEVLQLKLGFEVYLKWRLILWGIV